MEHILIKHLLLFLFLFNITISCAAAADFLQNPDFEIPPHNITTGNSTSHKWLLNEANSIPGWSLNGTVWYVASGDGSHSLQLGLNGKINQKFKPSDDGYVRHYVLSFTLSAQSIDCANNHTALNVTFGYSYRSNVSRVIYLQENSSTNLWERHALFLGQLGGKNDYVHIDIKSVPTISRDHNTTSSCWPIVDAFAVKKNDLPRWYNGNMFSNGGFEVGPAFLKNSSDGIILNELEEEEEEEKSMFHSPLQEWSILGNVRYIDSKHYKVPRGQAAVELLSSYPSGVQKNYLNLQTRYRYTLNFTIGDANDGCMADFIVYVQVGTSGTSVYNFTIKSNGSGSAFKKTLKFRVDQSSSDTSIAFYSLNETRTREGVLCGPVLDDIFLTSSSSFRDILTSSASGSYGELVKLCCGVSLLAFVMMIVKISDSNSMIKTVKNVRSRK